MYDRPRTDLAPSTADAIPFHDSQRRASRFAFIWFLAWLGTVAAGAFFGVLAGGGLGFLPGAILAGFFGAPVVFTFAVLAWAFWLTRYAAIVAAITGGCTGLLATAMTGDYGFGLSFVESLCLATFI